MPSWVAPERSVYRDVEAAARQWVKEQPGSFDVWGPRWELSKKLAGATNGRGSLTDNYCAQVLRALNTFVEEGWLVKVGERRDARYMTQEVKRLQDEASRQLAEQTRAEMARWDKARAELTSLGYQPRDKGRSISLDLEEWERVIDQLIER